MTWLSFCARRPGPEWKLSPVQAGMTGGADPDHVKGEGVVGVVGMNKAALALIDITHGAYRWLVNTTIVDGLLQRPTRPGLVRKTTVALTCGLSHDRPVVLAPSFCFADIRAAVFTIVSAILCLPLFIRERCSLRASGISEALTILVVPGSFLLKRLAHTNMVTGSHMVTQA